MGVAFRYTHWFCVSQRNLQNEIAFLYSTPNDRDGTIHSIPKKGYAVLTYPFKAFAARAATEEILCLKGDWGRCPQQALLCDVAIHKHCLRL